MITIFLRGIMYGIFLYAALVAVVFPVISWYATWLKRPRT